MFISLHLLSMCVVFKSSAWSSKRVSINKLNLQLYVPVGPFVYLLVEGVLYVRLSSNISVHVRHFVVGVV